MTRPHSSGSDDFDPAHPDHWPPPPEPPAEAWEKTRTDIVARLPPRAPRKRWVVPAAGGLIAAGVLVTGGVWVGTGLFAPPTGPTAAVANTAPADPLAEYDVLPVATAADVMVSAVRGGEVRFGSISHPVPETMPLASGTDVIVHRGPTAGELCVPEPNGMAVYVMPPTDK